MFSLDNFYYVLHANFLQAFNPLDVWFNEFGDITIEKINIGVYSKDSIHKKTSTVLFYDQEPLVPHLIDSLFVLIGHNGPNLLSHKTIKVLANSEISKLKTDLCREHHFYDWYYFFHGLAALEWYRDFKYVPKVDSKFTKVFITLNHLVTKDRSYRLNFVAQLLEKNLDEHGHVSCQLADESVTWRDEILNQTSKLSKPAKKLIYTQFSKLTEPLLVDDVKGGYRDCSSRLNLPLQESGLWHVVTETVFYYDKLHLTEKTFKPIVARRPFMLLAAPGNLTYLKSYGFKTFDRWIDESYDCEQDPDKRIAMVVAELEKLSNLDTVELETMYQDMQEVLDHNFDHFYGNFKHLVVTEMINNFEKCLKQINIGRLPDKQVDITAFDPVAIYQRLMQ